MFSGSCWWSRTVIEWPKDNVVPNNAYDVDIKTCKATFFLSVIRINKL